MLIDDVSMIFNMNSNSELLNCVVSASKVKVTEATAR